MFVDLEEETIKSDLLIEFINIINSLTNVMKMLAFLHVFCMRSPLIYVLETNILKQVSLKDRFLNILGNKTCTKHSCVSTIFFTLEHNKGCRHFSKSLTLGDRKR